MAMLLSLGCLAQEHDSILTPDDAQRYDYFFLEAMVQRQKEKYGWEFLFLGANIDAVETAARFGINEDRAVNFCNDAQGQALNYSEVSEAVRTVRACGPDGPRMRRAV